MPYWVNLGIRIASLQPKTHNSNTRRPALDLNAGHVQLLPSALAGHMKLNPVLHTPVVGMERHVIEELRIISSVEMVSRKITKNY